MVAMTISGCCNECEWIELDLDDRCFVLDGKRQHYYTLSCVHEKVCGRLEEEARRRALKPDGEG